MKKWIKSIKDLRYPIIITAITISSVALFQNVTTVDMDSWTQIVNFKSIIEPYYDGNIGGYSNTFTPSGQVSKFSTNANVCDYRIRTYGVSDGKPFTYIANANSAYASNGGNLQLKFNYEDIKPILGFKCLNGEQATISGQPTVVQFNFYAGDSAVPSKMLLNSNVLTNGLVCGTNLAPTAVQLIPYAKQSAPLANGGNYTQGITNVTYARLEHRCYSLPSTGTNPVSVSKQVKNQTSPYSTPAKNLKRR